ncbi:MAG: Acetyl-CoA acetyltransferase (thiolase II-like), partial [Deltaproteobacteria bacterium]|nr:Acetyl-CoA acetyltransferase (thiolase II-like) [Deltaproteobacteria bacterium]
VDELYMGVAVLAGTATVAARQILFITCHPPHIPTLTNDRACCSSMTCIGLGLRNIRSGEIHTLIAGGMEAMSQTPLIARGVRWGVRLGGVMLEEPLFLRNPILNTPLAVGAAEVALQHGVGREEQDQWALRSHQKYFSALEAGKIGVEIQPVEIPAEKGSIRLIDRDESPRSDTTIEKLRALPTVYGSKTVTAGNAPGLNDGASALVLPAHAIRKALEKVGRRLSDLKRLEINEAFAATALVSTKVLSSDNEKLLEQVRSITNVNGGAVAIGHPTGASGGRIVTTLVHELRRIGGGLGAAAICGGYGQSDAVIVEVA